MIDKLVYECINKHEGGERFFDALDDSIRNEEVLLPILKSIGDSILKSSNNAQKGYVVSGGFGRVMGKYLYELGENVIILEGSLRFNEIQEQNTYKNDIQGMSWVFIDDSYFLGRTVNKVKELIEKSDGEWCGVAVAYDGSKQSKREDLKCLYRYYDNFKHD